MPSATPFRLDRIEHELTSARNTNYKRTRATTQQAREQLTPCNDDVPGTPQHQPLSVRVSEQMRVEKRRLFKTRKGSCAVCFALCQIRMRAFRAAQVSTRSLT